MASFLAGLAVGMVIGWWINHVYHKRYVRQLKIANHCLASTLGDSLRTNEDLSDARRPAHR